MQPSRPGDDVVWPPPAPILHALQKQPEPPRVDLLRSMQGSCTRSDTQISAMENTITTAAGSGVAGIRPTSLRTRWKAVD